MGSNLAYFRYIARHKFFVFLAIVKVARHCGHWPLLIWRGLIHDWQKLTPAEWGPYVQTFYGPWEYNERPQWLKDDFNRAWLHHIHRGPHHWQYWILHNDDGSVVPLDMPESYILEMIADWSGAGRAIHGEAAPSGWYEQNRDKIVLSGKTRERVEAVMRSVFG